MRKPRNKQHRRGALKTPPGFLTVRQAMEVLACSEATVRRLIRDRKVRLVRWRYRVLLAEKDLRRLLKTRPYREEKPAPACAVRRRKQYDALDSSADPNEAAQRVTSLPGAGQPATAVEEAGRP